MDAVPPAPPAHWSYAAREGLVELVARADPTRLRHVLVLVFGDAPMRAQDEFSLDFETLDDHVCSVLDTYLRTPATDADAAFLAGRRAVGLEYETPLDIASHDGDANAARLCLEQGADINASPNAELIARAHGHEALAA